MTISWLNSFTCYKNKQQAHHAKSSLILTKKNILKAVKRRNLIRGKKERSTEADNKILPFKRNHKIKTRKSTKNHIFIMSQKHFKPNIKVIKKLAHKLF